MDLEMVLNELSLRTPAADIPTAQQWMSDFLATIRTATAQGVKKVIRTQSGFQSTMLAPDYPVARWRNDNTVDREARLFFKTLISKAPFLADVLDVKLEDNVDLSEFKHKGIQASGLGIAYLLEILALSVASEECWDFNRLELELRQLDENGELIDEIVEIVHASCSNHVEEHAAWIQNRIRIGVINGSDLWNRREELFPNLEFCENVGKQMESLGTGNPMLQQVVKRLFELEEYCQRWTSGSFNPGSLPCKVSPESDSRLKQFRQELTFECPDGKKLIFSWHVRMTPGAWRLHFSTELGPGKIIIGYIGSKIQ
jgi:hypothetical protein